MRVPLDYDTPSGRKVSIALVRVPATDTSDYRGSLFLNPGGPGGSGVDFALGFGPVASDFIGPVVNKYDLVGFDPRGVARSDPLKCFGALPFFSALRLVRRGLPNGAFPLEEEEIDDFEEAGEWIDKKCSSRIFGTKLLGHMSTANVARDLDLLREFVGDERLNFYGISYGSFLGQTYANLFPNKVGAFIIDGVLDPIAWSNEQCESPVGPLLGSTAGANATLAEFIAQCNNATAGNCALAPDAQGRIEALLERLESDKTYQ